MENKNNLVVFNTLFLTISKIITLFISILITMLLSKQLSLYDYGTYSQGVLIVSIFSSLTILGLTDAANLFFNKYSGKEREEYLSTILFIQSMIGLFTAAAIMLFAKLFVWYFDNENLLTLVKFIAFMPMFTNLISVLQIVFISIGKAKLIAIRNLVISIIKLIAIYFIIRRNSSVLLIFLVLISLDLSQYILFRFYLFKFKFHLLFTNIKINYILKILKFSVPMAIAILVNALNRDLDKFVIGKFTNTEVLAIYTNASKILPFDIISFSLATILIPYITRYISNFDFKKTTNLFRNYITISMITTWILALGVILLSKESIIFLYGDKYIEGNIIFIIYILVDMARFANISIILSSSGNSKKLMKYSIFIIIINLFLNVGFFFLMGIYGPAIATLISNIIYYALIIKNASKILKTTKSSFFDFKVIKKLILSFLIVILVFISYDQFIGIYPESNFVHLILFYGIYLITIGSIFYNDIRKSIFTFSDLT